MLSIYVCEYTRDNKRCRASLCFFTRRIIRQVCSGVTACVCVNLWRNWRCNYRGDAPEVTHSPYAVRWRTLHANRCDLIIAKGLRILIILFHFFKFGFEYFFINFIFPKYFIFPLISYLCYIICIWLYIFNTILSWSMKDDSCLPFTICWGIKNTWLKIPNWKYLISLYSTMQELLYKVLFFQTIFHVTLFLLFHLISWWKIHCFIQL